MEAYALLSTPSLNHNPQSQPSLLSPGHIYAILAYGSWGLLPIYWKLLGQVPAVEILSHRMIWSLVFLSGLLLIQQRQAEFRQLLQNPRHLGVLFTTAALLSLNWGIYIYGVNTDRVIETSLGYFINPLVNVLLGFIVLRERLHWGQKLAVVLATTGVAIFIARLGTVPWIALGLAFTFAFYGLLRKIIAIAPMLGLAVETAMMTPLAIVAVLYWSKTGVGHLGMNSSITLLLMGAGIATSFPLLWFNNAAKRLRFSTLGFFQYIAPSIQLVLGVWFYQEPFTRTHGITFGFIWSALFIYSTTSVMFSRKVSDAG